MAKFFNVPAKFYRDHAERELPTPIAYAKGLRTVELCSDDPVIDELLNDALHYSDGVDGAEKGLIMSARATVRAIHKVRAIAA
jgi:hypothetical protein